MSQQTETAIRFAATVSCINSSNLVRLPKDASEQLASRGQVAVRGSINGRAFRTVLEPDGMKGHWIKLERNTAKVRPGDPVEIVLEVTRDWPEPDVPADLAEALDAAPTEIQDMWADITPMARWEWVRWVNATANAATRARRVAVTISKMNNGKRRPCCFDLSACTDPTVAKNGKLREAT